MIETESSYSRYGEAFFSKLLKHGNSLNYRERLNVSCWPIVLQKSLKPER